MLFFHFIHLHFFLIPLILGGFELGFLNFFDIPSIDFLDDIFEFDSLLSLVFSFTERVIGNVVVLVEDKESADGVSDLRFAGLYEGALGQ